ncbi:peptidase S28 [Flagelloscypha sp. PMI_526]|nr:peptidase S28 [Flagelloscypha sp. PMI_526]
MLSLHFLVSALCALPALAADTAHSPAYTFTQPLDHFDPAYSGYTFGQRYWVSTRHYNGSADAPVIVLDGGETSGAGRIPFLDYGIVDILTKATGGVGVVLEHRYYGESVPVQNFTTDSLRWLNNKQALADSDNFLRNVNFTAAGITQDLRAPKTKWIYYGGSYAGARAAHMRVLYPKTVFGGISSSGVTEAIIDYWQYLDTIRRALDKTCSSNVVGSTFDVDWYLDQGAAGELKIKTLFGLEGLSNAADFGSTIGWYSYGGWQGRNWDPAIGDTSVDDFCAALNLPPNSQKELGNLPYGDPKRKVQVTVIVTSCGGTLEQCFGTQDDSAYQGTDLSQTWRLWTFQVCTQWGYYQGAPPPGVHVPSIISKRVDLAYNSKICKQAFQPGKFVTVPDQPDVASVNKLGGFGINYDRLAIIDGIVDPWRAATPHSEYIGKQAQRPDTIQKPFKLIGNGGFLCIIGMRTGLPDFSAEPQFIQDIQNQMIGFVKAWLKEKNCKLPFVLKYE